MDMISLTTIVLLLATGVGAGFVSGLLGIAGGVILIPLLLEIENLVKISPDIAVQMAFGSSLLTGFFTSLSGSVQHRKNHNIRWRDAIWLSISGSLGALAGSFVSSYLSGAVLKPLFGVAAILAAFILLFRSQTCEKAESRHVAAPLLVCAGGVIGALSSLVGLGGGIMLVPFLIILLSYPTRLAIGTSGAVIPLIAISGATGYIIHGWGIETLPPFSMGYVNLFFVLCTSTTSILAAPWGVKAAVKIRGPWLNLCFAGLLVWVALKMFGI
jgi:uncharacterized membrane protein YfcA